jgi:hypothetical protein
MWSHADAPTPLDVAAGVGSRYQMAATLRTELCLAVAVEIRQTFQW